MDELCQHCQHGSAASLFLIPEDSALPQLPASAVQEVLSMDGPVYSQASSEDPVAEGHGSCCFAKALHCLDLASSGQCAAASACGTLSSGHQRCSSSVRKHRLSASSTMCSSPRSHHGLAAACSPASSDSEDEVSNRIAMPAPPGIAHGALPHRHIIDAATMNSLAALNMGVNLGMAVCQKPGSVSDADLGQHLLGHSVVTTHATGSELQQQGMVAAPGVSKRSVSPAAAAMAAAAAAAASMPMHLPMHLSPAGQLPVPGLSAWESAAAAAVADQPAAPAPRAFHHKTGGPCDHCGATGACKA